jgi:hypothetical protein
MQGTAPVFCIPQKYVGGVYVMSRIIGPALPNMPWEAKPQGCASPVWRYSANPIIRRDAIPSSNSVFNSAAVPFRGKFAGVFRCDNKAVEMNLFAGFSNDGYSWKINHEPIVFQGDPEITKLQYRYDARVCQIEDKYYITWCNGYHGPTMSSSPAGSTLNTSCSAVPRTPGTRPLETFTAAGQRIWSTGAGIAMSLVPPEAGRAPKSAPGPHPLRLMKAG